MANVFFFFIFASGFHWIKFLNTRHRMGKYFWKIRPTTLFDMPKSSPMQAYNWSIFCNGHSASMISATGNFQVFLNIVLDFFLSYILVFFVSFCFILLGSKNSLCDVCSSVSEQTSIIKSDILPVLSQTLDEELGSTVSGLLKCLALTILESHNKLH